ncbi:MAG: beta-L-arabinofuranosidase domain-containing protein [Anaerolineae bacterium]
MPNSTPIPNRSPLAAGALTLLPLGAVLPEGWLRDQLRIQADGLTGHLEEIWPDVGPNSGWLGGTGESWERGPYYLDGLVPLAYLLHDDALIARAQKWIEWTLASQQPNGFFGPPHNLDWWPRMVMLKVLTQYQEATGDERVIPFIRRYLAHQHATLAGRPLETWAAARAADNVLTVYWLYNRTGESWLLELAAMLFRQSLDWTGLFHDWPYTRPMREYFDILSFMAGLRAYLEEKGCENLPTGKLHNLAVDSAGFHKHHVVNVAMGIKTPALWAVLTGDARHQAAARLGIEAVTRYHGQPSGVFSGDEHISGVSPTQGTELCAVVEYLLSLQTLLQADPNSADLADLMEKIAYNALPAPFSPDMCAHQYDQQANQVLVTVARRDWYNNTDDSNLFGLEPHFGCCTANMHQGWPKLLGDLWMATPDGGLAAPLYAPCRVTVPLAGREVTIVEETDYPFEEMVRMTVHCQGEATFPLRLRIPGWCEGAALRVNDGEAVAGKAGSYHSLSRTWREGDTVTLSLPMRIRTSFGFRNGLIVERGPLVFALRVQEEWRKFAGTEPFADWEVYPASPWNYAIELDPTRPEESFRVERRAMARQPFDAAHAPIVLKARARALPGWQLERNSAGAQPQSPVTSDEPSVEVELVPYGAAKLRVSLLPYIDMRRA